VTRPRRDISFSTAADDWWGFETVAIVASARAAKMAATTAAVEMAGSAR